MKNKFKFLMGLKIVAGITFFVLLFGFGTMHLWNWLVPMLFHGPIITFIQAIGLLILSKILFGGFGKGGRWGSRGHCGGGRGGYWKQHMEEKFSKMSPEEQAEFKEKFKNSCRGKYWGKEEEATEIEK